MVEFSGIEFRHVDNRVMSLKLVQLGLSGAQSSGPPARYCSHPKCLRKTRDPGGARQLPPGHQGQYGYGAVRPRTFAGEPEVKDKQVVELMEITMRNLLAAGEIDLSDFLARADTLGAVGKTVLISDYFEYYRLAAYLTRYTAEPIAVTMGVANVLDLFSEQYYTELEGGILEAFGKLFTKDLRLYVYPLRDHVTGQLKTVRTWKYPPPSTIYSGTWWNGDESSSSTTIDESVLHIFSRDVLKRIKENDSSWEDMVPPRSRKWSSNANFLATATGRVRTTPPLPLRTGKWDRQPGAPLIRVFCE